MKKVLQLLLAVIFATMSVAQAQSYSSVADGNWATTATWGTTAPASGHNYGAININNNITYTGNYTEQGSGSLNVNAGKVLTINGSFSVTQGATVYVYGNLVVNGDVTLSSNLVIMPGGSLTVNGNITVNNSNNLVVGTNTAAPPYADLIVNGNMTLAGSGDVSFNQNARAAIFGSVNSPSSSGGTIFNVNNGAQVYVHSNINFAGGGSSIQNNNTTSPYGLYVNGTVTNSGGGAGTTTNLEDKDYMQTHNPTFSDWLSNIANSPLPVTLASFTAKTSERNTVVVSWKTLSEINNHSFQLFRSEDAKTWTVVTEIAGAGNSKKAVNYSYTDAQAQAVNYYKLAQIDFDGTRTYSPVIVANAARPSVSVFPSTALNELNIQTSEAAIQSVMIYDLSGKLMFEQTNAEATSQVRVGVQNLPKGIYVIQFPATEIAAQRFIKQ
ncbi:Por secretion system C-terminal sorting domain-containing protein [Flexibacter flexilis DSM 6793]|uniref:Por secretion system C-terminal sorting domain-containing protein n=1 Tax=Flexibacter flexilis DSM 6793 TaxID=927664 RepID=A0A1I1DTI8_9BACT|nr:T9SS type A sorting domain-containing protein [Flexibacter flexilis]SFB76040.1 Por secretion system C-terminal sorting domain-containing protein [Flexibacter flexilis DSM 6793]